MILIEYIEKRTNKSVILDCDDIMDAVNHFKDCHKAMIENGDITYMSAEEV